MLLQDYQVVMDEQLMQCLPTSSTTHMAEIMGKKWRSCGTSRTECVRTPTCWSPVERTVRGSSVGNLDGKKYQIWDVCLFIENKAYFCQFLWMTLRWLDRAEIGSNVTTCIWDALSGNANRMKQSLNSTRRCLCLVFSAEATWKITGMAETSRTNGSVVVAQRMRGTILQTRK